MNISSRRHKKRNSKLISHIENNAKLYTISAMILIIGIVLGVISINHTSELQNEETSSYINLFIQSIKTGEEINEFEIFKTSIQKNSILTFIMWFSSLTLIGAIIIFIILLLLGYCLGYTVSGIIYSLGIGKGILFTTSTMLFQNLLFIPTVIFLSVYCIKQSKNLVENLKKDGIKLFFIKNTIVNLLVFSIFILTSFIEAYLSKNILLFFTKYL